MPGDDPFVVIVGGVGATVGVVCFVPPDGGGWFVPPDGGCWVVATVGDGCPPMINRKMN